MEYIHHLGKAHMGKASQREIWQHNKGDTANEQLGQTLGVLFPTLSSELHLLS